MVYPLILVGVLLIDGAWNNKLNIRMKSGSPGKIPCLYEAKYAENRKYLCKGFFWKSCSMMGYANDTANTFTITDHPAQSVFTVEWQNLQESDSGYYWWAVEIGDGAIDAGYSLYLAVQSAPDASVVSSSVSGQEGDNISVQCFYSSGYKAKDKQWCRIEENGCYTPQNSSVQISDDGESSFTVLMTGLTLSDSGWYFCSAGDLQVPVQLTVTKPRPKTADTGSRAEASMLNKEYFCL
ncbi:polymeric immunoglobulin receptor-like isoform X1 [Danio rerio]|uniref:polymeric immunoglobulin receptor-like isoform X1 n=1 Tax=Danio rerio TaxID=7955 RepID=UPI003CE49C19